jgi:hypothetical protein
MKTQLVLKLVDVLSQYLDLVHVIPSRLPSSRVLPLSGQHRSEVNFFLASDPRFVAHKPRQVLFPRRADIIS